MVVRFFLGVGEREAELEEVDDEADAELEPLLEELELELLERERCLGFDSTI